MFLNHFFWLSLPADLISRLTQMFSYQSLIAAHFSQKLDILFVAFQIGLSGVLQNLVYKELIFTIGEPSLA